MLKLANLVLKQKVFKISYYLIKNVSKIRLKFRDNRLMKICAKKNTILNERSKISNEFRENLLTKIFAKIKENFRFRSQFRWKNEIFVDIC